MAKKKVQINLSPSSSALDVHVSDELAGVLDKIVSHKADTIYLLVPPDAYISQNVLNFQLLKRESESVGKNLVIVSEDLRIQKMAETVDLPAQSSFEEPPPPKKAEPVLERRPERPYSREVADIIPARRSEGSDITDLRRFAKRTEQKVDRKEIDLSQATTAKSEETEREEEVSEKDLHISQYAPAATGKTKKAKKPKPSIDTKKLTSALSSPFVWIKGRGSKALIAVVVIAALGAGFYAAAFELPRATITLHPKSATDTMEFTLLADSNISSSNLEKGVIPAQVIEEKQEKTFTFESTGKADIVERAVGKIRVYNEYSSSPQTLVASTRFVSANEILFRTTETVVVPGAQIEGGKIIPSSILVSVEAAEPGERGNIGPTTFSIPGFKGTDKYLNFYGKSEEQMTGGYQGVATIATQEDLDKAKSNLETEFVPSVSQELRNKVPEQLNVLEESFEAKIDKLEFDAGPGDRKSTFTARVVVVAQAFLIAEEDLNNAIERYFINSTEYSKDYQLSDQRSVVNFVKEIDYNKGYVEFTTRIEQVFNRVVNEESIVEEIRGKNETEVRKVFSRATELEKAQVVFWPFWVKKVPTSPEDIEVRVDYGTTLEAR